MCYWLDPDLILKNALSFFPSKKATIRDLDDFCSQVYRAFRKDQTKNEEYLYFRNSPFDFKSSIRQYPDYFKRDGNFFFLLKPVNLLDTNKDLDPSVQKAIEIVLNECLRK